MSRSNKKNGRTVPPPLGWELIERVLEHERADTVYLWGNPGIGKTQLACTPKKEGVDVSVITLTPETPASELRGFWMPKGGEFVWVDGPFIESMRRGGRLVLNEISHASSDVLAILHPILESRETAALTLPNLETVRPAPGFQVIATDNLPPTQLPEALRDRFRAELHVDQPHPDALARLPEDLREAALKTFDLESDRAVSMRGWLSVLDFEAAFGREEAFRIVFGPERGQQLYNATRLGRV